MWMSTPRSWPGVAPGSNPERGLKLAGGRRPSELPARRSGIKPGARIETVWRCKSSNPAQVAPGSNPERGLKRDEAQACVPGPKVAPGSNPERGLKRSSPAWSQSWNRRSGIKPGARIETGRISQASRHVEVAPGSNPERGLKRPFRIAQRRTGRVAPGSNPERGLKHARYWNKV